MTMIIFELFLQVTDACAGMQQYLLSQGIQYNGEPDVEVEVEVEVENGQESNGNAMTY
jgi:hypothetical protein